MTKKKANNAYFNSETESYILKYNILSDPDVRLKIYTLHLQIPLHKIAISLCNKYKIRLRIQSELTVVQLCISSMIEKMPYFSCLRGKAFTYFTIIARNCILSNLHRGIKYNDRYRSIDLMTANNDHASKALQIASENSWKYKIQDLYNAEIIKKTISNLLILITNVILPNAVKLTLKLVCLGVLQLISDVDRLSTLNRKTVLLYLRLITELSTEVITAVLNKLGVSYFKIKNDVIENDLSLLQYQELI